MKYKSIRQLAEKLQSRELSARELTGFFLERSRKLQPKLNGYITITGDLALAAADRVDKLQRTGAQLHPLSGIPVAYKDNISTKGVRTTCASRALENYIPPFDAEVVSRLEMCPMLGKANLDEFAMGSANDTSVFGPVRNPWDLERVPGGSSGGSAALVAAGCVPFSLGSDTGGSIRQPAAFCGVTGLKPTYGRVSRRGLIGFAPSLDQIGSLTRSVEDCAMVFAAIAGHDPGDSTSAAQDVPDFMNSLRTGVLGLRIGLPREILAKCPDQHISAAVAEAAKSLEKAGALLTWVSFPFEREVLAAYTLLASAEASSTLARFDGVAFGSRGEGKNLDEMYTTSRDFGPEVRRRLILGTFGLGAQFYERGVRARRVIARHLQNLFQEADILLLPAAPSTAFKLSEDKDPLAMSLNDLYAIPANLAGLPALAVPCGERDGLPIGMQLMAPRFREDLLFRAGFTWQCLSDWHTHTPGGVD